MEPNSLEENRRELAEDMESVPEKPGIFKRLFKTLFPAKQDENVDLELPEELAPPPVQEAPVEDPANTVRVKGNLLYELFSNMNATPPTEDDEATFNLSVFMENVQQPTMEQRGWLKNVEREASTRLAKIRSENEEAVDCSILISLPPNKMSAWVFVFPPLFEGEHVSAETLNALLESKGIKFGIDEEKINSICEKRKYFSLMQVAAGVLPIDGIDGTIEDHYRREHEIQLKVKEDNTIDYKDLGWLQIIRKDEVVCDIVAPTSASLGTDVRGAEIKGRNGRKAAAPKGQNTAINEDESALVAAIDGVVSFAGQRFRVDPLLIINGNIETATGNLDVIGDVLINGDIQEGFTVKASGNITVQGMIEGAKVFSGGNIQVGRGMNGNSHGTLIAKGAVRSKYLENSNVTTGGNIICDTIINSTVSSDSIIEVKTGRGAIIGGSITALEMIDAKTIGNQSNRSTIITLGSTANLLREKQEAESQRKEAENEAKELTKSIAFLSRKGIEQTPETIKKLGEMNLKLKIQNMQVAKIREVVVGLAAKQIDDSLCRLRAEVLYPPVQVTIGSFTKTFRENVFNALIYCKEGEVHAANV